MPNKVSSILALDIGSKRIGVASADSAIRIASPLTTIPNDDNIWHTISELVNRHQVEALVVGLPRNLNGDSTGQTKAVETFVDSLKSHITLPIYWQDEALTSKQAEAELNSKRRAYNKEEIDALAATYILEDFLGGHKEMQT